MKKTERIMSMLSKRILVLLMFSVLAATGIITSSKAFATTTTLTDGSQANVQLAINNATAGDTIVIPASACPAGGCYYDYPVNVNKSLYIKGTGGVIIQNTGYLAQVPDTPLFNITSHDVTIGGISFYGRPQHSTVNAPGGGTTTWIEDCAITVANDVMDFCIKGCNFTNFGGWGIEVNGADARGVVSNCGFTDIYRSEINNYGYGVLVYGDPSSWSGAMPPLGTQNAVFVEDCTFNRNRHAIASNYGSKYVFRYNTVDNATQYPNGHSVDAHGDEYPGGPGWYGSRTFEIYGNTIWNQTSWYQYAGIDIRGGDGVIWNNSIYNAGYPILLSNRSPAPPSDGVPDSGQTRLLYAWNNNSGTAQIQVEPGSERYFPQTTGYTYYFNVSSAPSGYTPYTYPNPLVSRN